MSETRGPDILPASAPALSATSDAPVTPPAPPPLSASNSEADRTAGVAAEIDADGKAAIEAARSGKTTEPRTETTTTTAETTTTTTDATTTDAPARPKRADFANHDAWQEAMVEWRLSQPGTETWAVHEITALRNQRRSEAQRAKDLEDRLTAEAAERQKLANALEDIQSRLPPKVETETNPFPRREQFTTPEEYDQAVRTWATAEADAKAKSEAERLTTEKTEQDRRAAEEAGAARTREANEVAVRKMGEEFQQRVTSASERYPDYLEVTNNPDLKVSPAMTAAIFVSANGPDVAYFLGKNPAEAERIAALPNPLQQQLEIGALSERIALTARRTSTAPPPISPLEGGNGTADTTGDEPSMEAWGVKRTAELQAARKPFVPTRH